MAEQQEPIRRRVALKIIKLGMDTKQVVARFEAERQALAMMDHPNIAKVFEAGSTESGRPYFVMELVRGVAITKYCDEHDLTNTERLGLFVDACSAIQHAHQKGIIHRDVKPNNVMITLHDDRPVPKVIDFGIAKATEHRLTEKTLFTEYAQLIGTPAYMSPEQAQLSGLDIDTRSDIYSLGVLLYELLVGAPPFNPEQLRTCGYDEICRRIREVEPPIPSTRLSTLKGARLSSVAAQRRSDPSKLMRQVRGDLDWIVMKALEKDRRRRYDTATALANDVQRFLQGEPVTAVSPSTVYTLRRFASRNQGAIAAMTFVLLSLILATTISTWQARRAIQAEREKSQILLVAERARDEAMTKGKLAVHAAERAEAGELRAQHIAYASDMYGADLALRLNNLGLARRLLNRNRPSLRTGDFRNWEWRSLWMRCRERAVSVLGDRGPPVCSVSVSPDGHYVATGGFGNLVRVWRTSSGRIEKTLSEGSPDQLGLVVFSPKGNRLYATAADGTVKAWSIPSFAELPLQLRHGRTIRTMSLSDDGKILAVFGFDEVVSVWDLENSGTPARLDGGFAGERQWGALAISRDKRWLAIGLVGAIRIVNLETLDQKALIPTEGEAVKALTFSPDAEVLASASGLTDGTLDLWRVADGTRIGRLEGHSHYVYSLDYSLDGRQLASCGADQTVRLWDTKTWKERAVLRGHETEVWAIDIAAGAGQLVSGDKNGEIRIWHLDEHVNNEWPIALSDELPTGWHGLHSQASFSADGRRLATRNRDGSVSLRSAENLQETHRLTTLGTENRGVRFAPRQRLLAVGDANGYLTLLDPDLPQEMKRIALNPSAEIFPTSFSREGERLLAVARGGTQSHCVLISVADGQKVLAWSIPPNEECAALSPDGELVVTGHADGRACFWRVGEVHEPVIRRYEQRVDAVAFSPDGELLLMAIGTGEVEVWDVAKGTSHGRLRGHMQGVHAVQFSPDGKRAATAGSWGESVKLWDLVTEQEVATLSAEGFAFRQVEFSPDGNTILTVNDPGALHLWRVPSCEEILTAEDRRSVADSAHE